MKDADAIECRRFHEAAWLLLSRELDEDVRGAWLKHLAGCDECAALLAARRRALDVYDGTVPVPAGALDVSRLAVPPRRTPAWRPPARAVAAVTVLLLAVGGLTGRAIWRGGSDGDGLREVQRRLDEIEVQLAVARIDPPTAAERLKAAAGVALDHPDPRIVESLLDALETDPSPNVRLAVVDALYDLESTARVQERFEALLAAQGSPRLRIALIELAADRRLVETQGVLERVAAEPGDEAVRQRARWAISVLGGGA